MNAVRDCPAAKWFPSRHHFALARLLAFVRSQFPVRARTDVDHILTSFDRDQSAPEQYAIAIWIFVTSSCYIAAVLPTRWMVAAPVIAALAAQVVTGSVSVIGSVRANHLRRNSMVLFGLMIIASAYFAMQPALVRYVAWSFLTVVVLNAIAWIAMIALRNSVRELEERCGT
ncbi:MAG TPA: hypothetical protein VGA10_03405 [Thermoanaerobaculia bacterium]